MSLTKTLLRLSAVLKDRAFFVQICNSTVPHLLDPDGELSGTFIRTLFGVCGHDEGMQYFLQCSPQSKRYPYIVPEMLYGLRWQFHRLICRLVWNRLFRGMHFLLRCFLSWTRLGACIRCSCSPNKRLLLQTPTPENVPTRANVCRGDRLVFGTKQLRESPSVVQRDGILGRGASARDILPLSRCEWANREWCIVRRAKSREGNGVDSNAERNHSGAVA